MQFNQPIATTPKLFLKQKNTTNIKLIKQIAKSIAQEQQQYIDTRCIPFLGLLPVLSRKPLCDRSME